MLEHWAERLPGEFDFNELRAELGLPVLGPIDPRQQSVDDLPAVRLGRLSVEGLSDEDLIAAYLPRRRRSPFGRPCGSSPRRSSSGPVWPTRTSGSMPMPRWPAPRKTSPRRWSTSSKAAARPRRRSSRSASWDLMELSLRFAERNGQEAMRLIEHIQERHIEEPGVGETLTRMLIDVGLLRPDGTPAFGPDGGRAGDGRGRAPAAEPGGLWTPDSAQPGGGGGKLWTPE